MGEGDGKKDASDQIDDKEQLIGLKGDEHPRQIQIRTVRKIKTTRVCNVNVK